MGAMTLSMLFMAAQLFTVDGRITPAARASVQLHSAASPFNTITLSGSDGRFRFQKIEPGAYTLDVFVPGAGSLRRTIVIGPSTAPGGVFQLTIPTESFELRPDRSSLVTMSQLAVPDKARRHYSAALKRLSRNDVPGAVSELGKAIELAPLYSDAWNHLGTIRYQTAQYSEAEKCFRKALEADLNAYAPLVNLGGVLLNLNRPEEALRYNQYAVLREPADALAHSQLGMTFYVLGRWPQAEQSLKQAIRLDAAHFSHPQLILAEMYIQLRRPDDAATQLESFLKLYPDDRRAAQLKETVESLRKRL